MLRLTNDVLKVGDTVGYREKYDTGTDGFLFPNVGKVVAVKDGTYEVAFPEGNDEYEAHQLVLLERQDVVYAVQRYRTDTTKAGSETILKLYKTRGAAKAHVDNLNQLYAQDDYCNYRARVEPMELADEPVMATE